MLLCGVLKKDCRKIGLEEDCTNTMEPIDPALVRIFIAVKRHHDHSNFIRETFNYLAYSFRGSVNYYHDREHGSG